MNVTNEFDFQLYLITDRKQTKDQELLPALEAALQGGVRAVQLREKDLSDREVFELGCKIRKLTHRYGAKLLINDRADLALAVEADGVHLTQTSYPAGEARKIIGGSGIIGVSTHSMREARKAEEDGADFITLGPVFETPSKMDYGPPVGLSTLEQVVQTVTIPVFAIGGIKKENTLSAIHAGAHGIALISGILADSNVEQAAREFISIACSAHPVENKHTADR